MHITGHEAPSSYVIGINYDIKLSALTKFIDLADHCSQYLKTKCKNSGQQSWSWKGRNGTAISNFFPGGDPAIGGCTCKKKGGCAAGSKLIGRLRGRLRFLYDNEYENEICVCWYHHLLCSSWVHIRYLFSRRRNGSDESFISLFTKAKRKRQRYLIVVLVLVVVVVVKY